MSAKVSKLEEMVANLITRNEELMAQHKRDHETLGERLTRERMQRAVPVEEQTKLQIILANAMKDNHIVSFDYQKVTPRSRQIRRHHVHVEVITETQFFGQDFSVETCRWTPLSFNLGMVLNVEVSPRVCPATLPEVAYETNPEVQGQLLAAGKSTWRFVSNPF